MAPIASAAPAASGVSCYGITYTPERSGTRTDGHGETFCNAVMSQGYVDSTLYRDRWYGLEQLDDNDDGPRVGNEWDAYPQWGCYGVGTYTYYVYSYHAVQFSGNSTGSATTANKQRFTC